MRILAILLFAYLIWISFAFVAQRWLIYPGRSLGQPTGVPPPPAELQVEWLETSVGRVESWYLPPEPRADASPGDAPALTSVSLSSERVMIESSTTAAIPSTMSHLPPCGERRVARVNKRKKDTFATAGEDVKNRYLVIVF